MYISAEKIKKLINNKGLTLNILLSKAKVSKTAYYTQLRKDSVLPKSIHALAEILNVKPSQFLEEESDEEKLLKRLLKKLDEILKNYPQANRENVWHTLLLLQEKPIERLRRGLQRAQS